MKFNDLTKFSSLSISLISSIILSINLFTLSSCNSDSKPEAEIYEKELTNLNYYLDLHYEEINIEVKSYLDVNESLTSKYHIVNNIDNTCLINEVKEEYLTFDTSNLIDSSILNGDEGYKKVTSKEYIKDNNFNLSNYKVIVDYFDSISFNKDETLFSGYIKNANKYLNVTQNINSFNLNIKYDIKIKEISYTYIDDKMINHNVNIKVIK